MIDAGSGMAGGTCIDILARANQLADRIRKWPTWHGNSRHEVARGRDRIQAIGIPPDQAEADEVIECLAARILCGRVQKTDGSLDDRPSILRLRALGCAPQHKQPKAVECVKAPDHRGARGCPGGEGGDVGGGRVHEVGSSS